MKNALIVGYGFTAWSIDRALSERDFDVYGLRRSWDSQHKTSYSAAQVTGDITDQSSLPENGPDSGFDLVVNCVSAGKRGDPERYRTVYKKGSHNLIEWAKEEGVSKIIYTGSTAVYGDRNGDWVSEESDVKPESSAAEILVEAENLYKKAYKKGDLDTVVCRLTGIYGTGRKRVINRFKRGGFELRGNGLRYRNMIRRQDIGTMIGILASSADTQSVYNLTDTKPVTEKNFFQWLSEELSEPMPPINDTPLKRSSKRVSNNRFLEENDFEMDYPTFKEGYRPLLKKINND